MTRHLFSPSIAWIALCLCAAFGLFSSNSQGAIFVKIPGIKGESRTEGYDDSSWFTAVSGSYGAGRELPATDDGMETLTVGPGEAQPLGLKIPLGRAAAPLLRASITGNSIGDVEIHLVDVGGGPANEVVARVFAIVKLNRAFVKSWSHASSGKGHDFFEITLIYNSLEMTNLSGDPSGETGAKRATVSWNLIEQNALLTLISHPVFPDADGDGMSDEYESMHFGSATGGDPGRDSDGDGVSDIAEFLALTDPQDAKSFFEASLTPDALGEAQEGARITLKTEPGRVYELRVSTNLKVFFLLGSIQGDGGIVEFVDPNPGIQRFYQVSVYLSEPN